MNKLLDRESRGVDLTEISAFLFRRTGDISVRESRDFLRDLVEKDAPASTMSAGALTARAYLTKTLDDVNSNGSRMKFLLDTRLTLMG